MISCLWAAMVNPNQKGHIPSNKFQRAGIQTSLKQAVHFTSQQNIYIY